MKRLAIMMLVTASTAYADDVASVEEPRREPLVAPVPAPAQAPRPRPDQASGVAQEDEQTTGRWLWLPRTLLVLPRTAFWVAVQPLRGVAYVSETFRIEEQPLGEERRLKFYPVGGYESTYGFTIGARLQVTDLFNEGERLKLRANYGGEFRYAVGARLSSGERFGRVELSADTSYERRGRERFHGIGDGPDLDAPPPMPIDPSIDNSSIRARFSEDLFRTKLVVKTKIVDELSSRLTGAYVDREFGPADSESIEMSYQTDKLAGFSTGTKNVYVEHELALDTRRPATPYATQTQDGTGWLLSGHFGVARGVDNDPTKYYRYGGEIQRYFDLYEGTRILAFRAAVDAVGGTDGRTDGRISFVELPRLGGSDYLRGYASGRFRDRAVVLGSTEYSWQLSNHFTGYAFFDVGSALSTLEEVHHDRLRFGYGGGVNVHSKNTFYTRIQVASSREGGLFLDFVFSPAFGRRERAGRF
jgi:hypothetical protein